MEHADQDTDFLALVRQAVRGELAEHEDREEDQISRLADAVHRMEMLVKGGNGGSYINPGILGKLEAIDRSEEAMRLEIRDLAREIRSLEDRLDGRIRKMEIAQDRFRWTITGVAVGAGLASGGTVVAALSLLGKLAGG